MKNPDTIVVLSYSVLVNGSVVGDILSIKMELDKDDHVLSHRPQTSYQPRNVFDNVFSFCRMTQDASSVCQISKK